MWDISSWCLKEMENLLLDILHSCLEILQNPETSWRKFFSVKIPKVGSKLDSRRPLLPRLPVFSDFTESEKSLLLLKLCCIHGCRGMSSHRHRRGSYKWQKERGKVDDPPWIKLRITSPPVPLQPVHRSRLPRASQCYWANGINICIHAADWMKEGYQRTRLKCQS